VYIQPSLKEGKVSSSKPMNMHHKNTKSKTKPTIFQLQTFEDINVSLAFSS